MDISDTHTASENLKNNIASDLRWLSLPEVDEQADVEAVGEVVEEGLLAVVDEVEAEADLVIAVEEEALGVGAAHLVDVEQHEVAEGESQASGEAPRLSLYASCFYFHTRSILTGIPQEPHRHPGTFIARGKEDMLVTRNLTPGEAVYGEKRISTEVASQPGETNGEVAPATKIEYRVWNPFRSKLAAGILGGIDEIFMKPGSKVLYLGAASGTSVSHVSDIVGPDGTVFAVEFSHRSGRDLINMATHRPNIIPIIEDARHPLKYRFLVSMVDCIFADVAQPDQARIVAMNAHLFLKTGGGILISIKANCIDSTAPPEQVFAREVVKLREERMKPREQITLEPFERDHAMVACVYNKF
ncbi:MAG: hypothetical protein Q9165_002681 [Trypethelium subeluteriae]